jgi:hypothetical protein
MATRASGQTRRRGGVNPLIDAWRLVCVTHVDPARLRPRERDL